MPHRRAVFLDKDGTLIHDVPYNVDPSRIRLVDAAAEALGLLKDCGYRLLVITNQPGIAQGYFDHPALQRVEAKLRELLAPSGISLGGFYYCPHAPVDNCQCRKPSPGLLSRAAGEHQLSLEDSWMVGDILNDVEAGNAAGCRSVLIDNGNETEWHLTPSRTPWARVPTLLDAARLIATGNTHHV